MPAGAWSRVTIGCGSASPRATCTSTCRSPWPPTTPSSRASDGRVSRWPLTQFGLAYLPTSGTRKAIDDDGGLRNLVARDPPVEVAGDQVVSHRCSRRGNHKCSADLAPAFVGYANHRHFG